MKPGLKKYIMLLGFIMASNQSNAHNLVDLSKFNYGFVLDIRYATTNNFTGKQIYKSPGAFLHKNVADQLCQVQKELKPLGLGIKIWDAYRPHSAQWTLWHAVTPEQQKKGYVGDPNKGSNHNRGTAIDITLVTLKDHKEVVMPTGFDDFSEQAAADYDQASPQAIKNRDLLISTMHKHGFVVAKNEWWHFNAVNCSSYPVLDIPFEDINS